MVNSKGQASKYGWILVLIAIGYVIGVSSLVLSQDQPEIIIINETKLELLNSSLGKDFGYDIGLKDIQINSKVFDEKTNQKEGKKSKYSSSDNEYQIQNEFEEISQSGVSFVKETINITTNSTNLYNYSREIFLGTKQIKVGGKLITLTETPVKLNGSFVDNEWRLPNIFYGAENKRINFIDFLKQYGNQAYALAYNDSVELRIDNLMGSIYIDPTYANQTDGFLATIASATMDIGGLDFSNSTSLWIPKRGSAIEASVYEVTRSGTNSTQGFSTSVDAVNLEGVAINGSASDSWIWVIDQTNKRIIRYNQSREPTTVVSTFPWDTAGGICLEENSDGSTFYALYVNGTIARYSGVIAKNTLNLSIAEHGAGSTRAIDCDSDGSFWVSDVVDDFIYHFNSSGSNLTDGFFYNAVAGGTNIYGLAKDGNNFYLGDSSDQFIYHITCTDCNVAPTRLNITDPVNGTQVSNNSLTITYVNATDPNAGDQLNVTFELSSNSAFTTLVWFTTFPLNASENLRINTTLNQTTYWLRSIVTDGVVNSPYDHATFDVVNGVPTNPTNLLPANNTILTDTTPNLNWTNATDTNFDVLTYNLNISTDSGFSTIVYSATGIPSGASPTGHNVSTTLNGTDYFWRVRANDGTANGVYAFGNFTILANTAPSINATNTNPTVNISHSGTLTGSASFFDNDTSDTLNVTFKWYKDNVEVTSETLKNDYSNGSLVFTNTNITSVNLTDGSVWILGANVSDGVDSSSQLNSSSVTVVNHQARILNSVLVENDNYICDTFGDLDHCSHGYHSNFVRIDNSFESGTNGSWIPANDVFLISPSTTLIKEGNYSLNITADVSSDNTQNSSAIFTTIPSIDLNIANSANFTAWLYINTTQYLRDVKAIEIRTGLDTSTNYYAIYLTTSELSNGWNYINKKIGSSIVVGSPINTSLDTINILIYQNTSYLADHNIFIDNPVYTKSGGQTNDSVTKLPNWEENSGVWNIVNTTDENGKQTWAYSSQIEAENSDSYTLLSTQNFTNSTIIAKLRFKKDDSNQKLGLVLRSNGSLSNTVGGYTTWLYYNNAAPRIYLRKGFSTEVNFTSRASNFIVNQIYYLKAELDGSSINISLSTDGINWDRSINATDTTYSSGKIGLYVDESVIEVIDFFAYEHIDTLGSNITVKTNNLSLIYQWLDADGDSEGERIASFFKNGGLNYTTPMAVSYWTGATSPDGTLLLDVGQAGNSADGNISGTVCGLDGCLFDGADDFIEIEDSKLPASYFQNGFTISAWIRPDGAGEVTGRIIDKSNGLSSAAGLQYYLGTNTIIFGANSGTAIGSAANSVMFGDENYYHVLVTVNSSAFVQHYINGDASGTGGNTGALAGITTTNALRIGNRATATDRSFNGTIKDVRIYNRTLSTSEIQNIYHNRLGLDSSLTEDSEIWYGNVTIQDLNISKSSTLTSNVSIQNQVPVLANSLVNETIVYTDTNLNVSINITDLDSPSDKGNVTASLFVNDIWVQSITVIDRVLTSIESIISFIFDPSNWVKDDILIFQFNATDGTNQSNYVNSSSVTVLNSIPTITSISLNTTNPARNDTYQNITSHIVTSDADGDNVSYAIEWFNNNVSVAKSVHNESGLIAYYPFDNDALDYFGSNDGDTNNGVFKLTGKGYYFDNSSKAYIDLPENIISNANVSHSIGVKFSLGSDAIDSTYAPLIIQSDGMLMRVRFNDNRIICRYDNSGAFTSQYSLGAGDRGNHTAVCIFSDVGNINRTYIYVDGILRDSDAHARGPSINYNTSIGAVDNTLTYTFNGSVYEAFITTENITAERALSLHEVMILYPNLNSSNTEYGDNLIAQATPFDATSWGTPLNSSSLTILNDEPTANAPIINSTNPLTNDTNTNLTVTLSGQADNNTGDTIVDILDPRKNNVSDAVLNMPMEADLNLSNVKDYSTNSNNGTVNGATFNKTGGYDGSGAYEFDGINDNVESNGIASDTTSEGYTISFRLNPKTTLTRSRPIVLMGTTPKFVFTGYYGNAGGSGTHYLWFVGNGSALSSGLTASNFISFNQWQLITITYSSSTDTGILYKDGTQFQNQSFISDYVNFTALLTIGSINGGASDHINGTIDSVKIWNRTLSANEILSIYNNETIIHSDSTAKGQNRSYAHTVNDGIEDGETKYSETLTIRNAQPSTGTITVNETNASLYTNTDVNVSFTPSDPDSSDSLLNSTVVLFVNDVATQTINILNRAKDTLFSFVLDSANWVKNQILIFQISLTDGNETIYSNTSQFLVNNSLIVFEPDISNQLTNVGTTLILNLSSNLTDLDSDFTGISYQKNSSILNITIDNSTKIVNLIPLNSTVNGYININLTAYDTEEGETNSFNLTIQDVTNPIVNLLDPLNNTAITAATFTLNATFNVSDTSDIINCTLYVQPEDRQNLTSIQKDTNISFTPIVLQKGDYDWRVTCTDQYDNVGSQTFKLNAQSGSSGGTSGSSPSGTTSIIIQKFNLTRDLPLIISGKQGEIKGFVLDNQSHTITFNSIRPALKSVELIIKSTPQSLNLEMDESRDIILDNDNITDINIELISIDGDREATLKLTAIDNSQYDIFTQIYSVIPEEKIEEGKDYIMNHPLLIILAVMLLSYIIFDYRKIRNKNKYSITAISVLGILGVLSYYNPEFIQKIELSWINPLLDWLAKYVGSSLIFIIVLIIVIMIITYIIRMQVNNRKSNL